MLVLKQTLLHVRVTKSSAIEADLASYVETVYDGLTMNGALKHHEGVSDGCLEIVVDCKVNLNECIN